jgi:hypothetical protein
VTARWQSIAARLVLAGAALAPARAAPPERPVTRGQSPAEVRARLGPPARVSRQILFGRHLEQWAYDDPQPIRVEFSCVRGEEPYVCAILQLSPDTP